LTTKFSKEQFCRQFRIQTSFSPSPSTRAQFIGGKRGGRAIVIWFPEKKNGALFSFFSEFFETRHVHVLQLLVHGVFVATGIVSLLFQAT